MNFLSLCMDSHSLCMNFSSLYVQFAFHIQIVCNNHVVTNLYTINEKSSTYCYILLKKKIFTHQYDIANSVQMCTDLPPLDMCHDIQPDLKTEMSVGQGSECVTNATCCICYKTNLKQI